MIRFEKFYLVEGGNVKVGGNLYSADKIPVDKLSKEEFESLKKEIIETIKAINNSFEEEYHKPLWPNLNNLISNKKIFSGSTKLMFSKDYDEFKRYKKVVGDIDLQIPEENMKDFKEFLPKYEGENFGKMVYFGQGGRSPIQVNTIFKTGNYLDKFQNIQMDFEPTFWEKGEPTNFSIFSHSSSWEDIKKNIKGVFVKLLLRALIGREKLGDIAVITKTGKISNSAKYDNPSLRGFSVDKGLRIKFKPIMDKDGNIKKTEDGKPMYRANDTKVVKYERDLDDIFTIAYGKNPDEEELKMFHSFIGNLKLMKKYLDKEIVKSVFDKFMEIIFGELAQEIEQGKFEDGINVKDFEVKKSAYDEFVKVFPYLKMNDKELKKYVEPLYKMLQQKKENK
jgi:hypothetical protein